jgi:integrase
MPKLAKELGALAVSRLDGAGLHFVGGVQGLALHITSSGARSWILRVMVGGARREMGLGSYPEVTLAMARDKAREARELIRQGVDPIERQRAAQSALRASVAAALTFEQCARAYIAAHEVGWKNAKHGQQWRNTLETYAYPLIGPLLVRDVAKEHILMVLQPIWTTKTETASRLRGRLEVVLSYAMQAGYRPEGLNPARWRGGLDRLLPAPGKVAKAGHHPALGIDDVGEFVQSLKPIESMGARALEFAILTAARSGEVRGATLHEIDRKAKVWTIPAERMKAGREHRVPLTDEALAVIDQAARLRKVDDTDVLFPGPRGGQLSDMTLTAVLRRLGTPAVPHGFRSTFKDWAAERTNFPNELTEMALAHTISDKTEAAYRRGDLFEKRRRLMRDWAAFIARPSQPAEVVELARAKRRLTPAQVSE